MLNSQSIVSQLQAVDSSVYRARLPFEIFSTVPIESLAVSRYEILKAIKQLESTLSEIELHQQTLTKKSINNERIGKDPKRF